MSMFAAWRQQRRQRRTNRILAALHRHPTEEFTSSEIAGLAGLAAGGIYPILYQLEREGTLTARWQDAPEPGMTRRHRLYRLTSHPVS